MNREIKFRAIWQHDETGRICETYYTTGEPIIPPSERYILIRKDLQYTGLKDKSGKEIYEGDVIESVKNGKIILVDDIFLPSSLPRHEWGKTIGLKNEYFIDSWTTNPENYKIIGTFMISPELLEEIKS